MANNGALPEWGSLEDVLYAWDCKVCDVLYLIVRENVYSCMHGCMYSYSLIRCY